MIKSIQTPEIYHKELQCILNDNSNLMIAALKFKEAFLTKLIFLKICLNWYTYDWMMQDILATPNGRNLEVNCCWMVQNSMIYLSLIIITYGVKICVKQGFSFKDMIFNYWSLSDCSLVKTVFIWQFFSAKTRFSQSSNSTERACSLQVISNSLWKLKSSVLSVILNNIWFLEWGWSILLRGLYQV